MAAGTKLVGRGEELRRLRDWQAEAAAGAPRLVLLEGEAGVGKSRLLDELLDGADGLVLRGRCQEDPGVPYLPLAVACNDLPGAPVLAAAGRGQDDDRAAMFLQVTHALGRAAEVAPVTLAIDDTHWADKASVDLLAHIVAWAASAADRGLAMLIVLAHRPALTEPVAARARDRFLREPMARRIDLDGLDELSVNELVLNATGRRPGRQLLHSLIDASDGNPLLVTSLLHRLDSFGALTVRGGVLVSTATGDILGLPAGLDSLLQDRIAAVSMRCRQLLQCMAFLGDGLADDEITAVSGLPEEQADALIDEAITASVLVADLEGYRFAHPQLRQLLYHAPRGRRRRQLHLTVADRIEALRGMDDEQTASIVAHHLRLAGDEAPPDRVAAAALLAANHATAVGAWADAWQLYETALDTSKDSPIRSGYRSVLHVRAAKAAWFDHDNARAERHATAAITHAAALRDLPTWGRAVLIWAQARWSSAEVLAAGPLELQPLEDFLEAAGETEAALRSEVHSAMATTSYATNAFDAGDEHARAALVLAEESGDPVLRARAGDTNGFGRVSRLDLAGARLHFGRAAVEAQHSDDGYWIAWLEVQRGQVELLAGALGDAAELLGRASASARSQAYWAMSSVAYALLASQRLAVGDLDGAQANGREAVLLNRWSDYGPTNTFVYPALASARAKLGDREGADAALDEWQQLGGRGVWRYRHLVALELGEVEEVQGALEETPVRVRDEPALTLGRLAAVAAQAALGIRLARDDLLVPARDALGAAYDRGVRWTPGWALEIATLL